VAKRVTKGNLWGFIQSRPYVSMADIRRLFLMDVEDAASLVTNEGAYYVGLPLEAADLIRQLWLEGRIILDLNPDVKARVVQGVYPARVPAGRHGGRSGGAAGGIGGRGRGAGGAAPETARGAPGRGGAAGGGTETAGRAEAGAGPPAPEATGPPEEAPDGAAEAGPDGAPSEEGTGNRRRRRRKRRPTGSGAGDQAGATPVLATAGE
jgi:hypothetical protein